MCSGCGCRGPSGHLRVVRMMVDSWGWALRDEGKSVSKHMGGRHKVTFVGGARHALHDGPPVHQFIVVYGAQLQQRVIGVRLVALQLREQALCWRLCARRARHDLPGKNSTLEQLEQELQCNNAANSRAGGQPGLDARRRPPASVARFGRAGLRARPPPPSQMRV